MYINYNTSINNDPITTYKCEQYCYSITIYQLVQCESSFTKMKESKIWKLWYFKAFSQKYDTLMDQVASPVTSGIYIKLSGM